MPNSKYRTKSRKETPWTYKTEPESDEKFIDDCINNLYKIKHPSLKKSEESEFLNSLTVDKCRKCGSIEFKRNGTTSNGTQRYWCKSCKRTFTVTTNTLFENHKIPVTEWVDFLLGIFRSQSFNSISKSNRNSYTTTGYWLAKLYLVLENYQDDIVLKGDVQIDETYYSVIKKDIKLKEDGKKFRGLSRNKICIGIGCDKSGRVYCRIEGMGKPNQKNTLEIFKDHIKESSRIEHDMDKAHKPLVEALKLISVEYNSADLKGLPDNENPLNPINSCC